MFLYLENKCYNKLGDDMNNKKGFTLVELLAVIAILAIIVILALPNVIKLYTDARKNAFVNEARTIYKETTNKFINESVKGNKVNTISSKDNTKLDMTGEGLDYCVILDNKGKVKKLAVGNGSYYIKLSDVGDVESITKEDVQEGKLDDMKCDASAFKPKLNCKFDGEMVQGVEYVNGQYTYRYMQEGKWKRAEEGIDWVNMDGDGWGVQLTDKSSTDFVTTELCTTINDKPVISMAYMFADSQASSIDMSNFNTSNVTDMHDMFNSSKTKALNLSNFDTSNVVDMSGMFTNTDVKSLDLSSFNTSNVTDMHDMFNSCRATTLNLSSFDTSKVTTMNNMFNGCEATSLNLSSFNTSNVTDMHNMFAQSYATSIYLSSFNTGNVTNMESMFDGSKAVSLDLKSFDTSKVTNMEYMFLGCEARTINVNSFNTSKVTNMSSMFAETEAELLDLSSFDTSSVSNISYMFYNAKATTGYAKDQTNADKFNNSSNKPSGLTFVVK